MKTATDDRAMNAIQAAAAIAGLAAVLASVLFFLAGCKSNPDPSPGPPAAEHNRTNYWDGTKYGNGGTP